MEDEHHIVFTLLMAWMLYMPITIFLFVVYIPECSASLKLWHAAKQRNVLESNLKSEDGLERDAQRLKMMDDLANRERAPPIYFTLIALGVTSLKTYLKEPGVNGTANGKTIVVAPWHYLSWPNDLGGPEKLINILLVVSFVLAYNRASSIIHRLKDRILAVDGDGGLFTTTAASTNASPGLHRLVSTVSFVVPMAAILNNPIAMVAIYPVVAHLMITSVPTSTSVSLMNPFASTFFSVIAFVFWPVAFIERMSFIFSSTNIERWPTQAFMTTTTVVDWGRLLLSMLFSFIPFAIMSFCYRLDNHISTSEVPTAPLTSFRISSSRDKKNTDFTPLSPELKGFTIASESVFPRIQAKPCYFNASLAGWIAGYVILLLLAGGCYVPCPWESIGIVVSGLSWPFMVMGILVLAAMRGEVRMVWAYKEDWRSKPSLEDGVDKGLQTGVSNHGENAAL